MQHHLKDVLDRGQPAFVSQLRLGTPAIAELFGHAGFDGLSIDSEHAPQTPRGIQAQLQAIGCTPASSIVRIPSVNEELIRLYLDMGADGILAAFVNTPEEAELGAKSCRYPPRGIRGFGPSRATAYGLNNAQAYMAESDANTLFIPLIESVEAIENIEAILSVDGVDTCVIGPVDLSISMGIPFEFTCARFREAEAAVLAAAKKVGKPAGLGVIGSGEPADLARREIEMGFRLLYVAGDEPLLSETARQTMTYLNQVRDSVK